MRKQEPFSSYDKVSDVQSAAQIRALRRDDSSISDILLSCSHAAVYILEHGESVHWRKLGIEGFFYLVKRDTLPEYRFILKNQADTGEGDFVQSLDDDIRFEVKEGTLFYQIGHHGDVRGLWFHDSEFMTQLTRMIKRIYSEINLICDGSYDSHNQSTQKYSNTPNGGTAILQLLKKDTPYSEDPPRGTVSPVDVRSLLRKEFTSPIDVAPDHRNSRNSDVKPVSEKPIFSEAPRYPAAMTLTADTHTSNIRVNREDVRDVLRDMILSEKFVGEFVERLANMSNNRR